MLDVSAVFTFKELTDIAKRSEENQVYSLFFQKMAAENEALPLKRKYLDLSNAISECNRIWIMNVWEQQRYKEFLKTSLCRNKFCSNCKRLRSGALLLRWSSYLEEQKNLYHMVLTVPSVSGDELKKTIKQMFRAFSSLVKYFKGGSCRDQLYCSSWGFVGALRSFEVTYKIVNGQAMYHPHLHVLIRFDSDFPDKIFENRFSLKFGKVDRRFNSWEIYLQQLWFYLYQGIRIDSNYFKVLADHLNADSFDIVSQYKGFDCIIDPWSDGCFNELFKYITKAKDNNNIYMNFDVFKCLYESLYNIRQFQSYGCFYGVDLISGLEDLENDLYLEFIQFLNDKEMPDRVSNKPGDLADEIKQGKYIIFSKKSIRKYLHKLNE